MSNDEITGSADHREPAESETELRPRPDTRGGPPRPMSHGYAHLSLSPDAAQALGDATALDERAASLGVWVDAWFHYWDRWGRWSVRVRRPGSRDVIAEARLVAKPLAEVIGDCLDAIEQAVAA